MNFECGIEDNLEEHGWKNVRERYLRAVSSYKSAYYRFGDAKVNKENTDIITGMKVKLLDCDYAPADLPEQLPIICEVIRKIPGEDRPDYYLVRCEKEIKYNKYTIRYLVIAPRFMGQELRENVDEIALGVAYVGNISLLEDNVLDFNKCTYVAVCIGTTKDLY